MVKAYAESSTSIRVEWQPPPSGQQNGQITYYKIFYVPSTRQDTDATMVELKASTTNEFVIDSLRKWTEYRLWMLAGTSVGDGPTSYPVVVRTGEDGKQLEQIILKRMQVMAKTELFVLFFLILIALNGGRGWQNTKRVIWWWNLCFHTFFIQHFQMKHTPQNIKITFEIEFETQKAKLVKRCPYCP